MSLLLVRDHEFLGVEFDWAGVDRSGMLGYFSTAGSGPIPDSSGNRWKNAEELFEYVMEMPIISDVMQVGGFEKNSLDWIEIARRGLYAFDWTRRTSRYQLVAAPEKSLCFNFIEDEWFRRYVGHIELDCKFKERSGNESWMEF